jgi:surfeit locus 1 family protein
MPANPAMTTYFMQDSLNDRTTVSAHSSTWRLWAGVCAGLMITAIALWAATWQHGRAQQKLALQQQLDNARAASPVNLNMLEPQASDVFRSASVQGQWLPEKALFLDNRPLDGQVGRILLMPLRTPGGLVLLVQRGWLRQDAGQRATLPRVDTPAGTVHLEGVLLQELPHFAKFNDVYPPVLPALWPNFDWAAYRAASSLPDLRWILLQTNDSGDGLARRFTLPAAGVEKHLGYRLQWIAIALLAAGLTVFFGARAVFRKATTSS